MNNLMHSKIANEKAKKNSFWKKIRLHYDLIMDKESLVSATMNIYLLHNFWIIILMKTDLLNITQSNK